MRKFFPIYQFQQQLIQTLKKKKRWWKYIDMKFPDGSRPPHIELASGNCATMFLQPRGLFAELPAEMQKGVLDMVVEENGLRKWLTWLLNTNPAVQSYRVISIGKDSQDFAQAVANRFGYPMGLMTRDENRNVYPEFEPKKGEVLIPAATVQTTGSNLKRAFDSLKKREPQVIICPVVATVLVWNIFPHLDLPDLTQVKVFTVLREAMGISSPEDCIHCQAGSKRIQITDEESCEQLLDSAQKAVEFKKKIKDGKDVWGSVAQQRMKALKAKSK